jgi:hypothetical protein
MFEFEQNDGSGYLSLCKAPARMVICRLQWSRRYRRRGRSRERRGEAFLIAVTSLLSMLCWEGRKCRTLIGFAVTQQDFRQREESLASRARRVTTKQQ